MANSLLWLLLAKNSLLEQPRLSKQNGKQSFNLPARTFLNTCETILKHAKAQDLLPRKSPQHKPMAEVSKTRPLIPWHILPILRWNHARPSPSGTETNSPYGPARNAPSVSVKSSLQRSIFRKKACTSLCRIQAPLTAASTQAKPPSKPLVSPAPQKSQLKSSGPAKRSSLGRISALRA